MINELFKEEYISKIRLDDSASVIWRTLKPLYDEYGPKFITELFEDKILDIKDGDLSYHFCLICPEDANIKAHGEIIIASNLRFLNFHFARDFKRQCDISSHSKVILDSKDYYCNYLFARDVLALVNVDMYSSLINLHRQVIVDASNSENDETRQKAKSTLIEFDEFFSKENIDKLKQVQNEKKEKAHEKALDANSRIILINKLLDHHDKIVKEYGDRVMLEYKKINND